MESSIPLLSLQFFLLAASATILVTFSSGYPRKLLFFAANFIFVWMFLPGVKGALAITLFSAAGYLAVRLASIGISGIFWFSVLLFGGVFLYMRDYGFLYWVLPESFPHYTLATVGLSFVFFKILHVCIEVKSKTMAKPGFLDYMNFCLNFTTFMMGPIQRYFSFQDQWRGREKAIPENFESHLDAVIRILLGLVKAYVIAEGLSSFLIDPAQLQTISFPGLMTGLYAFFFFLYFNFSGYCDIVIGTGCLMGIRPPENFNHPYLARSISDFWLRFHRSLTQWLTDYVFSPFTKKGIESDRFNKRPLLVMNAGFLVTMLLSGIWHGTTLNFLFFGLAHGIYFVIFRSWQFITEKILGKKKMKSIRKNIFYQLFTWFITLQAVAFSFLFFQFKINDILVWIRG